MEVYLTVLTVFFIFSFVEVFTANKLAKKFVLGLSWLIAVLVIGLRWETGTDWYPYLGFFQDSVRWQDVMEMWSIEKGYGILNWLVRNITDNYSVFLFVHAMVFYGLLLIGFSKITKYPQTAFMFYFGSNLGIVGSNRQLLALAIIVFSLPYIFNKRIKSYILAVILAFSFHSTAFLNAAYIFLNRYISNKWIWLTLIIALAIGISPLPLQIFGLFGGLGDLYLNKTDAYISSADEIKGLTLGGVIKRLLFFTFFYLLRAKVARVTTHYNLLFNGYWLSIIIYLLFSSALPIMINRGSLYFNIMECLLFVSILSIFKNPIHKALYLIFLLVISITLMYQSLQAYPEAFIPYKGIFHNQNYQRSNF